MKYLPDSIDYGAMYHMLPLLTEILLQRKLLQKWEVNNQANQPAGAQADTSAVYTFEIFGSALVLSRPGSSF